MNIEPEPGSLAGASQEELDLSVRDLLEVLWRRLWVILTVAVILVIAVVGFDYLRTPIYQAQIKMLVGQEQENATSSNLGSDVAGLQKLTQTVAEVVRTRTVAEIVIDQLDLETTPEAFLENMSVQQANDTQVIEVAYRDPDPERARLVADTIGEVFSGRITEISPGANTITATVVEDATTPASPVSPQPVRDGLLALILGGMLGIGLAFLLEQLSVSWRSPEEVEQVSGVPTFGVIRVFEATRNKTGDEKKEVEN